MKINRIQVKSIITKSKLPGSDFVVNPYVGCTHKCGYCYACFMQRFTDHVEPWGDFVDIKENALEVFPKRFDKYAGKTITLGSVTDPYQPIEEKERLTRRLLERLVDLDVTVLILTKSPWVLRDSDVLSKLKDVTVAMSVSCFQEKIKCLFEPRTPPIFDRLEALRELASRGIKTVLFVSPIFPEITDWRSLVSKAQPFVHEFWFENLNFYPAIQSNMFKALAHIDQDLIARYRQIYRDPDRYFRVISKAISDYCNQHQLKFSLCFH